MVSKAIVLEGSAPPCSSYKRDVGTSSFLTVVIMGAWAMMLILRRLFSRVSSIPSIS